MQISKTFWRFGLDSTKFLEILKANKTPNKFSTDQLKITFKHQNSVRESLQICSKIRIPLDLKHLNFKIFSFISHDKYPNNQC